MDMKSFAAALCAAVIAAAASGAPAAAQTEPKKKQYVAATTRTATTTRPRARVVGAPRSFLDAGTEVKPGERKFTDYAYPPNYQGPTGVIPNIGGRVGWDVSPFTQQPYLGGFNRW